jgi:hypothetical protein
MPETLRYGMEPIELEPRYTNRELPGRCIKCLAEQELDGCLRELLRGEDNEEIKQRFEMLATFLKSPESQTIRDEAERYLAEGKRVKLRISFADGKPEYELKIEEEQKQ